MLCVVVPEVEDGDFSHLKGSALNVHSSVIEEREGRKALSRTAPAPSRKSRTNHHRTGSKPRTREVESLSFHLVPFDLKSVQNFYRKTENETEKFSNPSSMDA